MAPRGDTTQIVCCRRPSLVRRLYARMHTMSDEGVRIVSRLALVVVLILVTAMVRTLAGPSKRRGRIMGIGAVCGLACGVLIAMPVSRSFGVDVSSIAACMGMVLGYAVSWQYAKHVPRETP